MVKARAQKDKILNRWVINSPIKWQKASKKGFIIIQNYTKKNPLLLYRKLQQHFIVKNLIVIFLYFIEEF